MNKYALFFDIDGTLVSFETHEIPPSTILALTQAKANGHKVFIATGRPPIIITNLGVIEHLIDGYVTTNGALCFIGEQTVSCHAIPTEAAQLIVDDSREKDYGLIVVGERDVAVLDPKGDVDRIFRQHLAVKNLELAKPVEVVLQQRVLQMTPFFPESYEAEMMARIPTCTSGRWHPEFTDGNDTSMIRTAGIGVAMGNALESLKQEADYTTTSVDDNGILNALRHFELI